MDVTFEVGTAASTKPATCTADGTVTSLTVSVPEVGADIRVMLEPDSTATGQAAVVYRVDKL